MALGDEQVHIKLLNRVTRLTEAKTGETTEELVDVFEGEALEGEVIYKEDGEEKDYCTQSTNPPDGGLWSSAAQLGISGTRSFGAAMEGAGGSGRRGARAGGARVRGGMTLGQGGRREEGQQGRAPAPLTKQHGGTAAYSSITSRESEGEPLGISGGFEEFTPSPPIRSVRSEESSDMVGFRQRLAARGVNKVAMSGFRNGQRGTMRLPENLVATVEGAELLFIPCAEGGVIMGTANFYLARVLGMQIVDFKFLIEWASKNSLPHLEDYPVVSSRFHRREGRQSIQPLHKLLFEHQVFCVLDTVSGQGVLVGKLIGKMGGQVVSPEERDRVTGRVYTLSEDPVEGESVYQTDWVLDSLEVGAVLKPSLFLMEPEVDMACSQVYDWQTLIVE